MLQRACLAEAVIVNSDGLISVSGEYPNRIQKGLSQLIRLWRGLLTRVGLRSHLNRAAVADSSQG
jgi:hypothetical protein